LRSALRDAGVPVFSRSPRPGEANDAAVVVDDAHLLDDDELHRLTELVGEPRSTVVIACQPLAHHATLTELTTAIAGSYTVEELVDFPGVRYELLDGEAELLPGVHVVPTPGHVDGHQSLVVVCDDGSIVLAGQSHDTASAWSADALAARARELGHGEPLPTYSPWMTRLLAFDPRRVVFAHDAAVWFPD